MPFTDILCQDKPIAILQKAYAGGRWAHAYVFAGPDGVGRFKTALAWARLLLCSDPQTTSTAAGDRHEGCGQCRSCVLLEAGSHPDFHHVYKELKEFTEEGKGKGPPVDLPIDVIREFLVAKAAARPSLASHRVFVVSEAEKLNSPAQNALLKVLEEPPAYCSIILLCTRLDKLLPTIRSRTQVIRFGPVDRQIIVERLQAMGLDVPLAGHLAALAQGSLGAAGTFASLELAGAHLVATQRDLVAALAQCTLADGLDLAQRCQEQAKAIADHWAQLDKATSKADLGRRATKLVVWMILLAMEDAMRRPLMASEQGAGGDRDDLIERLAGRFGPEQAAERIADGFEALRWIEANVNDRLVFERFLLRMVGPGIMGGL